MWGLRSGREPLNQLLGPIAYYLDQCWWFYGGEWVEPANTPRGSHRDPKFQEAWAKHREEEKRRGEELDTFTTYSEIGRIGWPGFFTKFAGGLGSDWTYYFASDAEDDLPIPSFRAALTQGPHWFSPPENLPADICVFVRGIDASYWDVFFRDEWMFEAVWPSVSQKPHASRLPVQGSLI